MSFARAPLRASLRTFRPATLPKLASPARYGSSKAYAQQKMSGLTASGLALAGLFGWTAVIFSIGGPRSMEDHAPGHAAPSHKKAVHTSSTSSSKSSEPTTEAPAPTETKADLSADSSSEDDAAESQSAAYDPVTGEINWACPCLGGMADGPCGEEFKAAFSCFVYSQEEVKGVDCVEKFRGMQDCFRKYPDIYGSQDDDEEDDDADLIARAEAALTEEDTFTSSA